VGRYIPCFSLATQRRLVESLRLTGAAGQWALEDWTPGVPLDVDDCG